jgi:hypothetical protein
VSTGTCIADQLFELTIQPSSKMLEIANIRAMTRLEQDDFNSDQEVREHKSKDSEESTLSSNIEDGNLHNQQEI